VNIFFLCLAYLKFPRELDSAKAAKV